MNNFDKAFSVVVGEEGGWVNNPDDPGGETNWGVTWPTLRDAITRGIVAATTTIKSLTKDQSKIIYQALYWNPVKGDQLQWPLCVFVFDAAINQGVQTAIKMLQRALDQAQDGVFGTATLNAAEHATEWHCARFMAFRAMRYQSTKNADKFGVGWLTRTYSVAFKAGVQSTSV